MINLTVQLEKMKNVLPPTSVHLIRLIDVQTQEFVFLTTVCVMQDVTAQTAKTKDGMSVDSDPLFNTYPVTQTSVLTVYR